ncbi:hypothetical protein QBC46DRAFT_400668 [Diplogelasinospora grovesii]|uniref:Uncharacterized protein n=1 Tax=Diplogelasinospora grovesii TaxID=303347 RepID=A0AAN6MWE6_9PEZI|nr:hypothetical protein QBC46DRAFT_400668 [Diplogelasinospora grovesii]
MVEERGPEHHHIAVYEADQEAVPTLATSNDEDVHNPFIISHEGHSAAVDIVCCPTFNVHAPSRKHQTLPSILQPCCELDECLSTFTKYIYKVIHANFEPGYWVDGCCQQFSPTDDPEATCGERTREASLSLVQNAAAQIKKARRRGKQNTSFGGGGGSNAKNKNYDDEDQDTAQRMITKLTQGIQEVLMEDANPITTIELSEELANYRMGQGDDGNELEKLLWDNSVAKEKTGKESAWMHKHMFASSRCRRRVRHMEITVHPDVSIQETQKRWEESGGFLNELVNGLYPSRGELALVLYRAACKKNYRFSGSSRKSVDRRAKMLEIVLDGLRYLPISVRLDSRVMLPPVYLTHNQHTPKESYAKICEALKLDHFADLSFTDLELEKFAWDMPLSFLIGKRGKLGRLRIIEKDGVQFLTDSIANTAAGLKGPQPTEEHGRMATSHRQAFRSDKETTSEQLQGRTDRDTHKRHGDRNPRDNTSGKRPRRGRNDATAGHQLSLPTEPDVESLPGRFDGQSHRADPHTGGPLHWLLSPPASQLQTWQNDQVHTGIQFRPINADQHGEPATSLPDKIPAAYGSPQRAVPGLSPRSPSTVGTHPASSDATIPGMMLSNDIPHRLPGSPDALNAITRSSGQTGQPTGSAPERDEEQDTDTTYGNRLTSHDIENENAASPLQPYLQLGRESRSMEQPEVSGYSSLSGNVSLPDGSSLPIRYLEEQPPIINPRDALRDDGIGIGTGVLEAPSGVAHETMVSPEYENSTASIASPYPLDMLLEAVEQAARLDQVAEELEIFMDEVLDLSYV